jgi:hypothetical protein
MQVTITAELAAKQLTLTIAEVDWDTLQQENFYAAEATTPKQLRLFCFGDGMNQDIKEQSTTG